jgi:hypothetical protein
MNDILRFVLGIGAISALVALYAFVTNINKKVKAASTIESCDTSPTGGCCGHHDACTFDAKVQKIDGPAK